MAAWNEGRLGMSGAELEIQEALLALRRLVHTGVIRPTTRVLVVDAIRALEGEPPAPDAERPGC
jgi:hypothetical protein